MFGYVMAELLTSKLIKNKYHIDPVNWDDAEQDHKEI
jgi:hypothetical protein